MKYSFTFDTVAAYLAAKGDSTSALRQALADSSSLSRTCISTIKGTSGNNNGKGAGQTFVDSVNIIVPREQGGEIGDTLLFNSQDSKYYWLKGHDTIGREAMSGVLDAWASRLGSNNRVVSELTSRGYVIIGFVGHRDGDNCLIYADVTDSGYPANCADGGVAWDSYNGTRPESGSVPGPSADRMPQFGTIRRRGKELSSSRYGAYKDSWIASGSMERAEEQYESGDAYQYTWPIKRSTWNYIVSCIMSNTAVSNYSTGINGGSATVTQGTTIGVGSITYACNGNDTINPADYNYDFDTWYRAKVMLQFPTVSGCMTDLSGKKNTAYLVKYHGTATNSANTVVNYPSVVKCNDYGIAGVSDFAGGQTSGHTLGKWWMPSIVEMWRLLRNDVQLRAKGIGIARNAFWSNTQGSATNAWYVNFSNGNVTSNAKSTAYYVCAVTAFHI